MLWASFRPYPTADDLWHRHGFEDSAELEVRSDIIIADRYQVDGPLGQGAFGHTFRCIDLEYKRDVCVKVVKNSKFTFDGGLAEIKVLSQLTEHWNESKGDIEPPFVRLLDYAYYKEHLLIVTELLGETLENHLRFRTTESTGGCFSPAVQAAQLTQLLETLEFMHGIGIAHCDVKPDNICVKVDDPSVIKLIDYGACVCTNDTLNSYMQQRWTRAPEVMLGMVPGLDAKKMDVWSVACTAVQLHVGYPVFRGDSVAAVLAAQQAILGPHPRSFLENCNVDLCRMYFTPEDTLYEIRPAEHPQEPNVIYKLTPISTPLAQLLHAADPLMLDLLMSMLSYAPGARPSVTETLAHPFIAKYKRREESNETTLCGHVYGHERIGEMRL